ncbi:hypothetical protein H0H87_005121 [Tephrocybe sp. NHM501043]|nr:hypothetical protein H0H87_005121 [Tephrocybe sp. NHM501043]
MPVSYVCLPEDDHGLHLGGFLSDELVAIISFFLEPLPINTASINARDTHRQVRFRKFACNPAFQGRGIGTKLLQFSLEHVKSHFNATIAWCDARTSTADWYANRGMKPFGEVFSKGPVEYIRMYIDLRLLNSGSDGAGAGT